MKMNKKYVVVLLFVLLGLKANSQQFTFTSPQVTKTDSLGKVIDFVGTITSTSSDTIRLCMIRTINNLPHPDWSSAICFDENCFPSFFDSVATTPEFNSKPLAPFGTKPFGLHVFTSTINGTATVQFTLKNLNNLNEKRVLSFTASTILTSNKDKNIGPAKFNLEQNYPNPFNPKSNIKYQIFKKGFVTLKVFDILGREIAILVDEFKEAGNYEVEFNVEANLPDSRAGLRFALASGVYFYRLTFDNLNETRKMIYLK